jgi:hypothetical protein
MSVQVSAASSLKFESFRSLLCARHIRGIPSWVVRLPIWFQVRFLRRVRQRLHRIPNRKLDKSKFSFKFTPEYC